jgi:hypothetical protein
MPADVHVLHYVISIGRRSEEPVGKIVQLASSLLEDVTAIEHDYPISASR